MMALDLTLSQNVKCSVSDDVLTLKINLNSDAAHSAEKMPMRSSSCEHSCMAVQDQVVEIQSLHEEIDRLNEELSTHVARVGQRDLTIQELYRMIQKRDQEIKRPKERVEALERDLGVMSQDYLTAVLALQENKTVDQAQKETIQQMDIKIRAHAATIQRRDAEIQRLKNRLYVFENTPFDNWVKRAEKAEVELEKIKGYVRGVVEDLKIGETPLSQFEDVEFQITANHLTSPLTLFPTMVARRARQHGKVPDLLCASCGAPLEYSKEYDAHYCAFCHRWTEAKCEDPNCEFCSKRPENPLN